MPYAVDTDEYGNTYLIPGLVLNPLPNNGRLTVQNLLPGDVLVWYASKDGNHKNQFFIREFTEGPYTHAGIYVGGGISIDAGPSGVKETALQDLLNYFEIGNVLRYPGIKKHEISKVVEYAIDRIGFKYAHLDARLLPLRRGAVKARYFRSRSQVLAQLGKFAIAARSQQIRKKSIYCSQLVVEAYACIGKFGNKYIQDAAISPNDLLLENYFDYAGFISKKQAPNFSIFDVNAPVQRTEVTRWRPSSWKRRFHMALWGHR